MDRNAWKIIKRNQPPARPSGRPERACGTMQMDVGPWYVFDNRQNMTSHRFDKFTTLPALERHFPEG